jgi:hypothetical protein
MNEHHTFFLSHASEDKSYALKLKRHLEVQGYTLWFDIQNISWGDDLTERIDTGLTNSFYGIVVLSPHYLAPHKTWTIHEFNRLMKNHKIFIILHNIELQYIQTKYPRLHEVITRVLVIDSSSDFSEISRQLQRILEEMVGKKFYRLFKHLSAQEWPSADIETYNLIREERLLNFSNEDLMKLSSLWSICSSNRYGFKIQQKIYQEAQSYRSFCKTVEWDCRYWTDILDDNFNRKHFRDGHFPMLVYFRDELNCPVHGDAVLKPADFARIKQKDVVKPQLFAWLISMVICIPLVPLFHVYLVVSFGISLVLSLVVGLALPVWWKYQRTYILRELFTKHDFQKTRDKDA